MAKSGAKGLIRRGKHFGYDFMFQGRRMTGTTGHTTKTKAEAWLGVYRTRLSDEAREGKIGRAPASEITLGKVYAAYKSVHRGPGADRLDADWRNHILPVKVKASPTSDTVLEMGDMIAVEVGQYHAEQLRIKYLEGPSRINAHLEKEGSDYVHPVRSRKASGANKLVRHLGTVFGWAVEVRLLPHTVAKPKRLQEQEIVRHFLEFDELGAFLAEVDKPHRYLKNPPQNYGLHMSVIVRAMVLMALREDEARYMRWSGFSSDMTMYQPYDTKTGTTVGEPCHVLPTLKALLEKLPKDGEWVLPGGTEEGVHDRRFTAKAIKRASEAIGVRGISPHRMRGSAATMAAQAGGSAFEIMVLGNWKRVETAQKYVKLARKDNLPLMNRTFPGM